MSTEINCFMECKDWIILLIGFGLSISWALFIYSLRPKLIIRNPKISSIDQRSIDIPVENIKVISMATKIDIEVAVIVFNENGDFTYHFKTDLLDFAFIPSKNIRENNATNIRKFKAYDCNDYLRDVLNLNYDHLMGLLIIPNNRLRVRIHATHSFSGLGRTFESYFKLSDTEHGIFEKCKE